MYICSICNLFGASTFSSVLRHIGLIHRYDPGLSIRCGIDYCPQVYSNYESFRSHVYRKHREALHPQSSTGEAGDGNGNDGNGTLVESSEENEDESSYRNLPILGEMEQSVYSN